MISPIAHYSTWQTKTPLWLAECIVYVVILTASSEAELALETISLCTQSCSSSVRAYGKHRNYAAWCQGMTKICNNVVYFHQLCEEECSLMHWNDLRAVTLLLCQ